MRARLGRRSPRWPRDRKRRHINQRPSVGQAKTCVPGANLGRADRGRGARTSKQHKRPTTGIMMIVSGPLPVAHLTRGAGQGARARNVAARAFDRFNLKAGQVEPSWPKLSASVKRDGRSLARQSKEEAPEIQEGAWRYLAGWSLAGTRAGRPRELRSAHRPRQTRSSPPQIDRSNLMSPQDLTRSM